jgi:hypothetical protein
VSGHDAEVLVGALRLEDNLSFADLPGLIILVPVPLHALAVPPLGWEQTLKVCAIFPLFRIVKTTVPAGTVVFESVNANSVSAPAATATLVAAAAGDEEVVFAAVVVDAAVVVGGGAAAAVIVCVTVRVPLLVEWPIAQPTTPAGTTSAKKSSRTRTSPTVTYGFRGPVRATTERYCTAAFAGTRVDGDAAAL